MCGIAGFLTRTGFAAEAAQLNLDAMTTRIGHRGPDDTGGWIDSGNGIALGQRRLAIIDLSPLGKQPMLSEDGRWAIVFNGEIYNFERIRAQLTAEGVAPAWRGHSDTEVLLAAISAWGVQRALEATIGMFAFALWDRRERTLTLARDRAGEKPLYYGMSGRSLLFGSELKALRAHPDFDATLSRPAVAAYLRFGYVPAPLSIYQQIRKVLPGSYVTFAPGREEEVVHYWRPPASAPDPALADPGRAEAALEALLTDAIGMQMYADVPMGAFLSGGIDSSTIVALMQKQSSQPVRTFSIGFREAAFNEAQHAAEVARHLGTRHEELYVTARDALDVVPQLPEMFDEPFADSSQIPTYLLAKMTRAHVTVALSGDAGDELFGGYARYFQTQQFERLWAAPALLRRGAGAAIEAVPARMWDAIGGILPARLAGMLTPARLPKIGAALRCDDIYAVYRRLVSQWPDPQQVAPGLAEPPGWMDDPALRAASPDMVSWMMAVDFRTYLPDDILVKVDRASMATSLETRVPLLDHRIIEFASRLPMEQKVGRGVGKQILRRILYRHVPQQLIDRPKQGFGVPIAEWLRGPLREWAEELLSVTALERSELFDVEVVRYVWSRHIRGEEDLPYPLWTILMFQAWYAESMP